MSTEQKRVRFQNTFYLAFVTVALLASFISRWLDKEMSSAEVKRSEVLERGKHPPSVREFRLSLGLKRNDGSERYSKNVQ